ncbi:glycosyltransferase family 2 protein [Natronococcus pandeyae]|uniref:glycosyltransferase family 2 protein n=1 Tax=Natronococcus pandeyae TaxID=2055836 RepID=UPI001F30BB8B|nr:glycosyltransferase family 2 protein [Natronococcus pandeyae]
MRDAQIKCVSCNAPGAVTIDDRHVCVECGEVILQTNRSPKSADGGTKSLNPAHSAAGTLEHDSSVGRLLQADSDEQPYLSFVLPTKNEERGVQKCLTKIRSVVEDLEILAEVIVSDSSSDRTPEIAQQMGAIVVEPNELGYGAAYQYGFEHVRGDIIVMGDADTTYDFGDLPKLLEPVENDRADMVLGSRLEGEIEPDAMPPLHKYIGNPVLTRFLNIFYNADVSDAHSGFRVFTREALESLELQSPGMEFASEMVMNAATQGLRIEEVPITYHEREGEAELDSFRDGWRHVKFMLMNCPSYLYAIPGLISLGFGLLLMGLSFFNIQPGPVMFGTHTMIAGSLLTILGYQVSSLTLFSAATTDPVRKPNDRISRAIESRFQLEYGASFGLLLFGLGAVYAGYLFLEWIASGFSAVPFVPANLLAVTAIILGLETIFHSFYLSTCLD